MTELLFYRYLIALISKLGIMRFHYLFLLITFLACSEGGSLSENKSDLNVIKQEKRSDFVDRKIKLKQQNKCMIDGEVLEENELWLKDQGKLICILADSSTYDPSYGLSHRILEVINTFSCELELKLTLPVNVSPDFPYFLADINYNNGSKIVAIKAAKSIYCLDLTTNKLLPILKPSYKQTREEMDASTGNILRLEVWENFLVGFAQGKGAFVFDLSQENGKAILPFAEYKITETDYNSLFLLPSNKGKFQAILPTYDWEEGTFGINPIFEQPRSISVEVQKSALDNQYLVLRSKKDKNALLVDMKAKKRKELPAELLNKPTKQILSWAKKEG